MDHVPPLDQDLDQDLDLEDLDPNLEDLGLDQDPEQ